MGLTTEMASVMPAWLAGLPREDGFVCLSDARRFQHDEAKYDEQYRSDPGNMMVGRGLLALLRRYEADVSGPALEVGCGTGLLSLGLAAGSPYPLTILTDPSPAFLKLTRDKIRAAGVSQDRVCYGLLLGEEVDRLPSESLSLIVLRSTLHHILNVDDFIANAARALRPGGVLTFEEPCLEGYLLMGAMVQFLPTAARAAGRPLTARQEGTVELFVRSMAFYSRRDLDKTTAEDKHLFRADELMKSGERSGLTVEFRANQAYESFAEGGEGGVPRAISFLGFMRGYLRFCMSWDDSLMAAFEDLMPRYCEVIEEASKGSWGPHLHGVFVCRKEAR